VTLLDEVQEAAQRVREKETDLTQEREALAAMRRAYQEGIPIARIARAAGMTRQRVYTLVHRRS
jgi:DNA-binding phage protein